MVEMNLPTYREKQIRQAFWRDLAGGWDEVTVLPKDLREKLAGQIEWDSVKADKVIEGGNSVKTRFKLDDDNMIEAVLIKHGDGRRTVCVSSQVGCPLGCSFCATGRSGFKRNLKAEEIVEQVLFFARLMKNQEGGKVTNVVFMGMGEPFLNYDNIMKAVKILNDKEGINLGARHISISTCGIVPGIKKLASEKLQLNLAFSLHAPNEILRAKLMPIEEKHSLKSVLAAIDYYIKKTNRRVMIGYVLIKGINDSAKAAEELSSLMRGRPLCYVNLILYNPVAGEKLSPTAREDVEKFVAVLDKNKIKYTIRRSFGSSIAAACGQLAGRSGG